MSVKVKIPSLLRQLTNGQEVVEVTAYSVIECLDNLVVQFPGIRRWLYNKQGQLFPFVYVFVNGETVSTDELTNPLKDGDELLLLIAIGGG